MVSILLFPMPDKLLTHDNLPTYELILYPEAWVSKHTPTDYPIPNGRPEEIYTNNIIQTKQALLKNIYEYTYMHITTMKKKL